ncbi:SAM-dependent methyltransferase [Cocleimonas flava]|uniref:SAM-dependent MidA family methyltransferase n=1 Tax=Cocleimonas flava TaxID=634765 RepID=A0A4R1F1A2_9GAMM|nr:SAM-dependent methyltransferase [Cocleimonas flava]TCJ85298.1 SAM-dependent MidA family methyltransferase [Cocleimonas flava]
MKHVQSLPEPSADALEHSEKLVANIKNAIESNGGSISFKRYMEMALYEPCLGYYVAGTHKIGEQGDFTTAPQISPLFSQCIANQCAEVLKSIYTKKASKVGGCIFEFGAGTGIMAAEILLELEKQNSLPETYFILDLSPELQQRQKQTIESKAPHLLTKVTWLTTLPKHFSGIVLANEVLDAMPVDVFTQHGDIVYEHHVIWQDDALLEQLRPATETNPALHDRVLRLNIPKEATPYTSEINSHITHWLKSIAEIIEEGLVLLIDYGYPRKEYYLAERNKGTLICHYQHLVNEAPLLNVGLQDITANVDFTAVAEAADSSKLEVAGFTSQACFLANTGLEEYFKHALENNLDDQYTLAQQVRTLTLPAEMGERFKCIGLTKNYPHQLCGFKDFDQRYRL